MYKSVLVPVDGSKLSYGALDHARGLCASLGADLTVMTCSPVYPTVMTGDGYVIEPISPAQWKASIAERNTRIGDEVARRLDGFAHKFVALKGDQIHEAILHAAKKSKADLVVMASHGRSGVSAFLLGSQTNKVLTHSKIPVLVCR